MSVLKTAGLSREDGGSGDTLQLYVNLGTHDVNQGRIICILTKGLFFCHSLAEPSNMQ